MKRSVAVLLLFLFAGAVWTVAQETKGKILIIDETREFAASLQLEAMARVLIQQGFSIAAIIGFPEEPVEGAPFDFVLVIPQKGKHIWLCLPPTLKPGAQDGDMKELEGLKALVREVFRGERELRTPAEDLWPLLLSLKLAELGIFGEG
jgi:hypothetical protein